MNDADKELRRIDPRDVGFSRFSLRTWHGMSLDAWLRMMRGHWGKVSPARYPLVVTITAFSVVNLGLKLISRIVYGRRLAAVEISPDPIFVIGHWRSGTTWLHNMMMIDPNHAAPDVAACFHPECFLVGRAILRPFKKMVMNESRPMDNVRMELTSAEEDEHGILLGGAITPYRRMLFPCDDLSDEVTNPEDMSPKDAEFWRKTWLGFLRRVQFVNPGKRLVLKSPSHTLRTAEILRLFPDARFIHIVRDPYKIFRSSEKTRVAMASVLALQTHMPTANGLEPGLIRDFVEFHADFHAVKDDIPDDQLITIRYEDLRADPPGVLREIYTALDLGDYDQIAPLIEAKMAQSSGYKTNEYGFDDATIALIDAAWHDYFERYGYAPMSERAENTG